jgi:hypothetical protein
MTAAAGSNPGTPERSRWTFADHPPALRGVAPLAVLLTVAGFAPGVLGLGLAVALIPTFGAWTGGRRAFQRRRHEQAVVRVRGLGRS